MRQGRPGGSAPTVALATSHTEQQVAVRAERTRTLRRPSLPCFQSGSRAWPAEEAPRHTARQRPDTWQAIVQAMAQDVQSAPRGRCVPHRGARVGCLEHARLPPDCVVNFQPMAIVNIIDGWSCDSASCINGKPRAELSSTSEGNCPPRNPMDCGPFVECLPIPTLLHLIGTVLSQSLPSISRRVSGCALVAA